MAKPKTMVQKHKRNFETLKRAFENGDVALVECQRARDGEIVAMLCAMSFDGSEYKITPFAEMVNGNPFEMYRPPNPDGGFVLMEGEV